MTDRIEGCHIRPLGARVVLLRCTSHETYGSTGLVVPEQYREENPECVVVAVGPGEWTRPTWDEETKAWTAPELVPIQGLKPGDRVLIGRYTTHPITIDGEDYIILDADMIRAVIEPDDVAAQ